MSTTTVPASLLADKSTSKELRAALKALEALQERDRGQVRAIAAAEHELEVAEARETKTAADLLRAGEPMPPSGLAAQRSQLEELRREGAALEHAIRDAVAAVDSAIDANRPVWAKARQGTSEQRRRELVAAVDAFAAAHEALRDALSVDAWLDGGELRRVGWVPALKANREPFSAEELVVALRLFASGEFWQHPDVKTPRAAQGLRTAVSAL